MWLRSVYVLGLSAAQATQLQGSEKDEPPLGMVLLFLGACIILPLYCLAQCCEMCGNDWRGIWAGLGWAGLICGLMLSSTFLMAPVGIPMVAVGCVLICGCNNAGQRRGHYYY